MAAKQCGLAASGYSHFAPPKKRITNIWSSLCLAATLQKWGGECSQGPPLDSTFPTNLSLVSCLLSDSLSLLDGVKIRKEKRMPFCPFPSLGFYIN